MHFAVLVNFGALWTVWDCFGMFSYVFPGIDAQHVMEFLQFCLLVKNALPGDVRDPFRVRSGFDQGSLGIVQGLFRGRSRFVRRRSGSFRVIWGSFGGRLGIVQALSRDRSGSFGDRPGLFGFSFVIGVNFMSM